MQAKLFNTLRLFLTEILVVFILLAGSPSVPTGRYYRVQAAPNQPVTILTVNDLSDPGGAACLATACSLRAAITAADAAGPLSSTIAFDLAYPAQINLSGSLPDLTAPVDIIGPGRDALTISGGGLVRIFTVQSSASLRLSGLTLSQGWNGLEGGGAIRNAGSLVLTNLALSDNLAGGGNGGGLLNDAGGDVQIANVDFTNNDGFHDGAIANSGSITLTRSVFSGNTGRVGGAVENYPGSSMTITSSAFIHNVAKISSGGAIVNAGTLVIANSTFSQNGSPTGADIVSGGTLHVTNSTFFGAVQPSSNSIAGGGAGSTIVLRSSILAAEAGVANCAAQPGGVFDADASNLSADASCAAATVVTPLQLNLSPLVEIAGLPALPPLPGSAAIDAGNDALCAAPVGAPLFGAGAQDQSGFPRPIGAHCDAGAVEFIPPVFYLPQILR